MFNNQSCSIQHCFFDANNNNDNFFQKKTTNNLSIVLSYGNNYSYYDDDDSGMNLNFNSIQCLCVIKHHLQNEFVQKDSIVNSTSSYSAYQYTISSHHIKIIFLFFNEKNKLND